MKKIFIIFLLILSSNILLAQNADSIRSEKVFGGYRFYTKQQLLSPQQMLKIMEDNQEAFDLMKSAKTGWTTSTILGLAGGFLIGYPVGTALAGGDPSWELAAIGGGLIVISIPIISGANKKAKRAVKTYNQNLLSYRTPRGFFSVNYTNQGMGIAYNF